MSTEFITASVFDRDGSFSLADEPLVTRYTIDDFESQFDVDDPSEYDWRDELPGFCPTDEERDELNDKREADELLRWLHRSPAAMADHQIIRTYCWTPEQRITEDESLTESEKATLLADLREGRERWAERQTECRRRELHRLLTAWFGTSDYRDQTVVTRWKQEDGRWVPGETKNVLVWIRERVQERGSELSGFASCAAIMRNRLARRRVRRAA